MAMQQQTDHRRTLKQWLPYILLVIGIIGSIASFALTYDKIHVLKNPNYDPGCNINPILSCGSVMKTEQASLLGVPNPIFGLVGFAMLATLGICLFAGAVFRRWLWLGLQAGVTAGVIFMHYLFFQGVYRIGAICPWCFVVWMVMIPCFWLISIHNLREKHLMLPGKWGGQLATFADANTGNVLVLWYAVIFAILLQRFWYYWSTLL
jgi:uncharacterized membrane protein